MDLSIIIVNWNSKDYLRRSIASILAETHGLEFEIVVIDSASFDGCEAMLREMYPKVQFIQSDKNLGFAKANNEAFQVSRGESVLFLNPDTELIGPAIQILFTALRTLPKAGAVGCKLPNSDRTVQTSCIQSFPTILNQVLDTEVLRQRFPQWRMWGMVPLFNGAETPSEVDAISGACLMVRRSLFEQVGGFTTDYFMYSEDVDICLKLRRAGRINYFLPSAQVVHHGGGSTAEEGRGNFSSVMMLESRWRYFLKTRSRSYAWLYRIAMMAVSVVRLVLAMLLWTFSQLNAKSTKWTGSLRKWRARLRWSLRLERWAENYSA